MKKMMSRVYWGVTLFLVTGVLAPLSALAEKTGDAGEAAKGAATAAAAGTDNASSVGMFLALAAGFGIAIAAFGGALGQGKAAAAALTGIARNPDASGKILAPMILALALIESLVIYALIISFVLSGQIGKLMGLG